MQSVLLKNALWSQHPSTHDDYLHDMRICNEKMHVRGGDGQFLRPSREFKILQVLPEFSRLDICIQEQTRLDINSISLIRGFLHNGHRVVEKGSFSVLQDLLYNSGSDSDSDSKSEGDHFDRLESQYEQRWSAPEWYVYRYITGPPTPYSDIPAWSQGIFTHAVFCDRMEIRKLNDLDLLHTLARKQVHTFLDPDAGNWYHCAFTGTWWSQQNPSISFGHNHKLPYNGYLWYDMDARSRGKAISNYLSHAYRFRAMRKHLFVHAEI